jgi:Flp pilus assembly pilin Flp
MLTLRVLWGIRSTPDRGGTAVEYVLIMAAIALVIVLGAIALGDVLDDPFSESAACAADRTQCP